MPINSYKLGPGTLTLGSGPLDVSAQVRACRVVPSENVETEEAVPVLTGEELPAEETATYTYTLEATLLQDLAAAGVVDYSWTTRGQWVAFRFVPSTAAGREVEGEVRVVPIAIGGDVRSRPTSDIQWRCRGAAGAADPAFGAAGP